ncbi:MULTISPECIES: flagellar assembly protein FliW [Cellulomonas]|jgi:flagellar assembly factor FliW|uniref:flagellar assembly protein FliW n=1 Tax=Cellulomonas TaxID=1707 RepID=UPI001B9FEDED|nr:MULTISPECIES: flagellar assembly protein FliW [Cellulomonas]VTR77525.1 Flagellar assembly factor FliW [Cellulomonas hominis]
MTIQLDAPRERTHLPEHLHLASPMPGLAGYEDFTLTPLDDAGVLYALRSEPDGARPVRLFVIDPEAFFPDYDPSIDSGVLDAIGTDPAHAVRLVVVRPADGGDPPTANLLAPLVLDPASGAAVQTVLTEDWPLRAPLGRAA